MRRFFLALAVSPALAFAVPDRTVSVGVGAGAPEIVFGAVDVVAARHWQVGFSYGIDGGLLAQALTDGLRDQAQQPRTLPLSNGQTYVVTPKLDPIQFTMLSPSLRFFPTDRNFYFQLSWTLLRLSTAFTGNLADPSLGVELDGVVYGNVSYIQHLPTLSIGHIFASKAFFVNVRLGASLPFTTSISITTKAQLPALVGGLAPNQTALQDFSNKIAADAEAAVDKAKHELLVIPSLAVTMGVFL